MSADLKPRAHGHASEDMYRGPCVACGAPSTYWHDGEPYCAACTGDKPTRRTDDEIIEAMAQAAWESQHGPWDLCSDEGKRVCRDEQRAALAVYRRITGDHHDHR